MFVKQYLDKLIINLNIYISIYFKLLVNYIFVNIAIYFIMSFLWQNNEYELLNKTLRKGLRLLRN